MLTIYNCRNDITILLTTIVKFMRDFINVRYITDTRIFFHCTPLNWIYSYIIYPSRDIRKRNAWGSDNIANIQSLICTFISSTFPSCAVKWVTPRTLELDCPFVKLLCNLISHTQSILREKI